MTNEQATPERAARYKLQVAKRATRTSEPSRKSSRMLPGASRPMLLATSVMAVISMFRLVSQVEAGGKGKGGRQGHIIIQNELGSGRSVPIYMPIPIPVPVPVGQSAHVKVGDHQHHGHHQSQHQRDNDSEEEVKKIYLIQLAQPRVPAPPNLKGGFSGPVQNHIHVGHHRYHRFEATPSMGGHHYNHQSQAAATTTKATPAADVKILPIVMIPPVAPVPPIQVGSEAPASTRMTLSPHFNNYLVQPSSLARSKSYDRGGNGQMLVETFNEYGGSLGGSIFRERFAGRSRGGDIRARLSRVRSQRHQPQLDEEAPTAALIQARQSQLARDSDYDDYDQTNTDQRAKLTRAPASEFASGGSNGISRRRPRPAIWLERRRNQSPISLNSINDIIDVYNRQQVNDELELAGDGQQPAEFSAAQLRLTRVHQRPRRLGTDSIDVPSSGVGRREPNASNMDISLDELASIEREIRQQQQRVRASHNDLNALYYDRGNRLDGQQTGSRPISERDPYDDDEWRFDSIKSVAHSAAPSNETLGSKMQNSTLTTASTRKDAT